MDRINKIFNYVDLDVDTNGSGWAFHSTELLKLKISKIGTLKMGKHIKFRAVASKNGKERRNAKRIGSWCVNVKNDEDSHCVLYNIVIGLFGSIIRDKGLQLDNPKNLKEYFKYINYDNIEFPINEEGTDATQLAISSFHLEALLQPYNLL